MGEERMTKGLIHIYTGEGKGKTTCSIGLAVRAAGQGLKVCIVQFLKGGSRKTGEFKLISERLPEIELISSELSHPMFLKKKPVLAELEEEAARVFELCEQKAASGDYDLLIMDEINNVVANNWLSWERVSGLLTAKPDTLEVVLTGRDAHPKLQSIAAYVTEMLKIKHPYDSGQPARRGIEY